MNLNEFFTSVPYCNNLSKLDAALFYATKLRVFPLWPNTKKPLLEGSWKVYATQDPETIRQWWTLTPDANIALCMGGEVLASDLDMKDGENGWSSYQELEPGQVTAPMQITPSGGYHIFHGHVDGLINFTKKGRHKGIDLRTDGGYVVAAPSYVVDPDYPQYSGPYQWHQGGRLHRLNGGLIDAYSQWSQESVVKEVDQPDPSPYDELVPLESIPLRQKHLDFLLTGEMNEGYDGDRSAALLAATSSLYALGYGDHEVLSYLENSPGAMDCAVGHSTPRRALTWLWKYTCLKARKTKPINKPTVGEAFSDIELTSTDLPETSDKQRWVSMAEAINPEQEESAVAIYLEASRINPLFGNRIADILHSNGGFRKSDLEKAAKQHTKNQIREIRSQQPTMEPRKTGDPLPLGHPVLKDPPTVIASYEDLVGRYVYISEEDVWFDRYTKGALTTTALNIVQAHTMDILNDGAEEKVRASDILAMRTDTLKVDTRNYWPGAGNDLIHVGNKDAINTWKPSDIQPVRGDISIWWNLLCHLFPEELDRMHVLRWCAYTLQHPEIKINYALVIGGGERIGKDTVFQPLMVGLGRENCGDVPADTLDEPYEDCFVSKKLCALQEVYRDGYRDALKVENKLKNKLADPPYELNLRRLGIPPMIQRNLLQLIMFTNFRSGLNISSDGDRYLCLWSSAKQLTQEQYTQVYTWYEREQGYEKVTHFLLEMDVRDFNPKGNAPATEWRTEMREGVKSDIEVTVADVIDLIRQENQLARARRLSGEVAPHLIHEQLYVTPEQIMERVDPGSRVSMKALTGILSSMDAPLIHSTAIDNRHRVPRIFLEQKTFDNVPHDDKFKKSKKAKVYVLEPNREGVNINPSLTELKNGLCPARLIQEYLSSTN